MIWSKMNTGSCNVSGYLSLSKPLVFSAQSSSGMQLVADPLKSYNLVATFTITWPNIKPTEYVSMNPNTGSKWDVKNQSVTFSPFLQIPLAFSPSFTSCRKIFSLLHMEISGTATQTCTISPFRKHIFISTTLNVNMVFQMEIWLCEHPPQNVLYIFQMFRFPRQDVLHFVMTQGGKEWITLVCLTTTK